MPTHSVVVVVVGGTVVVVVVMVTVVVVAGGGGVVVGATVVVVTALRGAVVGADLDFVAAVTVEVVVVGGTVVELVDGAVVDDVAGATAVVVVERWEESLPVAADGRWVFPAGWSRSTATATATRMTNPVPVHKRQRPPAAGALNTNSSCTGRPASEPRRGMFDPADPAPLSSWSISPNFPSTGGTGSAETPTGLRYCLVTTLRSTRAAHPAIEPVRPRRASAGVALGTGWAALSGADAHPPVRAQRPLTPERPAGH
jgi:hypothetical protein